MEDDRNYVALRDYLEQLIAHESALNSERFASVDRAMAKAYEAMNIRLEGMNEFRRQIEAQEKRYAERNQLQALDEKVDFRLSKLEQSAVITGKAAVIWAAIVVGVAVLSAVFSFIRTT
jgi:hypothetical protein